MRKQTIASTVAGIIGAVMINSAAHAGGVPVFEKGDSKLKVEGKVFTKLVQDKETVADTKTQAATVDRAYVTLKYDFDKDWMMRITTDVHQTSASELSQKNNNIFLKYAYLQGKLAGDAAVLRLGQSHTPWIDYEQGLWKHRYFAKVMTDQNGYDASSDLGIGLKGKVANGKAKYFVTYTNGAGYSRTDLKGKSMDLNGRISYYPIQGLTLDLQYRNGYKGTKTQPTNNNKDASGTPLNETKSSLYQIMATYGQGHDYRVGVNYASNKADPTGTAPSVKDTAYALWGWTRFAQQYGAFARYEHTKDDQATASKLKLDHYGIGVEYFPARHVTLALGYDQVKKSTGGVTSKKDSQVGLWSEFKF